MMRVKYVEIMALRILRRVLVDDPEMVDGGKKVVVPPRLKIKNQTAELK